jgi:hypothetical protein
MKHTLLFLAALGLFSMLCAQSVTLPPSGANQKSSVTQMMGLVSVTIDYSSPDVTGPAGNDRRGQIWGNVVHYGMQNLGFGSAEESPWRAGANENTTIRFSHDVEVEGKALPAGKYGLHMMVAESGPWTLIFSNNHHAWGSYFYDPAEDALRVQVMPEEHPYTEWLIYAFDDRQLASCTGYLAWEDIRVPFKITVPKLADYYVENLGQQLQVNYTHPDFLAAASYCLQNNTHLDQGMAWIETALNDRWIGKKNFPALSVKSGLLLRMGKNEEVYSVLEGAIALPDGQVGQVHQFGRQLIAAGASDEALKVFQMNAKRFPDTWPVNVGLMRGYSAVGDYKKALKHAEMALSNVPEGDQLNKTNIENMIKKLGKNENIN